MDRHEAVEPSHHLVTPVIFGRRIEFCLGVSREGRNLLVGGILVFEQSDRGSFCWRASCTIFDPGFRDFDCRSAAAVSKASRSIISGAALGVNVRH